MTSYFWHTACIQRLSTTVVSNARVWANEVLKGIFDLISVLQSEVHRHFSIVQSFVSALQCSPTKSERQLHANRLIERNNPMCEYGQRNSALLWSSWQTFGNRRQRRDSQTLPVKRFGPALSTLSVLHSVEFIWENKWVINYLALTAEPVYRSVCQILDSSQGPFPGSVMRSCRVQKAYVDFNLLFGLRNNRKAAQQLPRDLMWPSSGLKELAQTMKKKRIVWCPSRAIKARNCCATKSDNWRWFLICSQDFLKTIRQRTLKFAYLSPFLIAKLLLVGHATAKNTSPTAWHVLN